MRQASVLTTGVAIQTTTSASATARKASSRSGMASLGPLRNSRRSAIFHPDTVALEPQREGEQAPELAAEIVPARDVRVDQRGHRRRIEESLPVECLRREDLARERLEIAPQPGGGRDREALLSPMHDLPGKERRDRLAQEALLGEAADTHRPRQAQGQAPRDLIAERDPSP